MATNTLRDDDSVMSWYLLFTVETAYIRSLVETFIEIQHLFFFQERKEKWSIS